MSRGNTLGSCVLWGLYCWTAYAAVEILLAYVATIAIGRYDSFPAWAWRPAGMVLGGYLAAGMLAGLLAGILLRQGVEARRRRAVAMLSVVGAFIFNLAFALPLSRSEYAAMGVAAVLAVWLVLTIWGSSATPRFLENPWIVSLLLFSFPWTSRELLSTTLWEGAGKSDAIRTAAAFFAFLCTAAIAWMWERMGERRSTPGSVLLTGACVLLAGLIVLWLCPGGPGSLPDTPAASSQKRPNVLLIVMDTVRADHLAVYGYERETTPHLKELAREATLFRNAAATSDFTLPTHASMFTGMYPSWHRAVHAPPLHPFGRPLDASYPTLAEILARQGYVTAAVSGNVPYFQPVFGLTRGFAAAYAARPVRLSAAERPFYLREGMRKLLSVVAPTADFDRRASRGDFVTAAALRLVDEMRNRPVFAFVNYIDAHAPYLPEAPYDTLFPGRNPAFWYADYEKLLKEVLSNRRSVSPRERDHLLSQYDGAIAFIDAQIGQLVAGLKRLGLYESTMIIVTADHGEAFGERNLMGHSVTSVYQDQIRVPLLIKYPGPPAPAAADTPASHVDVMPTVLAALGYPVPAHVQGINLRSEMPAPRVVLSEVFPSYHRSRPEFTRIKRALVGRQHKLIAHEGGAKELYYHERDPEEKHNIANLAAGDVNFLSAQLRELVAKVPAAKRSESVPVRNLEMLRSLGYAQ